MTEQTFAVGQSVQIAGSGRCGAIVHVGAYTVLVRFDSGDEQCLPLDRARAWLRVDLAELRKGGKG